MKKFWIAILACMTFLCLTLAAACSMKKGPEFNEGYLQEITLGEPIMLDEYVDPKSMDEYTLILTCDETGQERDLKMLGQWTTDKPGLYTLTYTVLSGENQGTISTKLLVSVPNATWQYSRPTLVYRAGDTMDFNLLKRNLNVVVKSYYTYEFFVKSITFNGQTVDVTGESSFAFQEAGEHVLKFGVRTSDGQELTADQKITVRPQQVLADGAEEWMEENNVTAHDYTLISPDGHIALDAGYYNISYANDNVPYVAFNGENGGGYGVNTYMMVEFTGKTLPQIEFFADPSSSFTDGKNGILLSNGTSKNDGKFISDLDASRLTIFGPWKSNFAEFDNKGRMLSLGSVAEPCPLGYRALDDNHSYRYIAGITEANTTQVTVRILLIDLTTGERAFDYTTTMKSSSGNGAFTALDPAKWNADYFMGSIVLYGRYGIDLEFDKVYTPITGVNDIYDLDEAAEFKTGYKTQYDLNSYANVSDYITIPVTDYDFIVTAPNGEIVEIAADGSFQYTQSGKYILKYDPRQEGIRANAISVRVMYDLHNPLAPDFLEDEGVLISATDTGIKSNEDVKYINGGSQSIACYPMNGRTDGTMHIYISKTFMEFIFLSRAVDGITFDVYSPDMAVDYKLGGSAIVQDLTGKIEAETWKTFTITRELCMRNFEVYKSNGYSIDIEFKGEGSFVKQKNFLYVDNVKLLVQDVTPEVDSSVQTFMTENNMTAYGYKAINADLSAELMAGYYQGEWYTIKNDDVPYIAYNGNYGAGSYVVVDFTGKNVPQMAFLVDRPTASLTDKNQGLYVHTGMIKKTGALVSDTDGGRITFFGPNKMEYGRPDADGRVGLQYGAKAWGTDNATKDTENVPSPLSIRGLEDGVHYRYVVGIKSAYVDGANVKVTLELLLINLDTNEEVVRYNTAAHIVLKNMQAVSGNIVMYGRYNTGITLDKIYALYTGVSDINAIDKVAEVLA